MFRRRQKPAAVASVCPHERAECDPAVILEVRDRSGRAVRYLVTGVEGSQVIGVPVSTVDPDGRKHRIYNGGARPGIVDFPIKIPADAFYGAK